MPVAPSIAASRTTSSILSALSTLMTSSIGRPISGAGVAGSIARTDADRFPASTTSARHNPPRPSKTSTSAPIPSRNTRTRCAASSSGTATLAAAASRSGT
jgi:hypothetical protein